jgi:DNA-directed RNA polymerase specialized sigma24 family protein
MSEPAAFSDLVRRLRAGAPGAAEEFLGLYGNLVRDLAHLKCLRHGYARPDLDSEEVHQSVLASFCLRIRLGAFEELDTPDGLGRLLRRMVENKVIDRLRKHGRAVPRQGGDALKACDPVAPPESGPHRLEIEELVSRARALFSEREWDLVQRRLAGQAWEQIGQAHEDSPEAARKRYERAVHRALHGLGLEE